MLEETLEETTETGDPKESESEVSDSESKPEPKSDLDSTSAGDVADTATGEGEKAPPEGAEKIDEKEQRRRDEQSAIDKRIVAAERRAAYFEGVAAEAAKKPPAEPGVDPFIAELDQLEADVVEEYGEGSTEHKTFRLSRRQEERERAKEIADVDVIYREFETLPNSFYSIHPSLRTDNVLFAKFQSEVDLRMFSQGGYDNFCRQINDGSLRLGVNSNAILKNIFEDSYRAATGKAAIDTKGKLSADKLKKAADTLGTNAPRGEPAPDNSKGSYNEAFAATQRYNKEVFEKFR